MKLVILLAITSFMCACTAKKQDDQYAERIHVSKQYVVDVDSLVSVAKPDDMTEVLITYDPNVKGIKKYQGIQLGVQLKRILKQRNLDAGKFDMVFVCKDGYAPVRHVTELSGRQDGYIVFKDLAAPASQNWTPAMEGAFSPYYLVWTTDSVHAGELPWPYGLVSIKLVEKDSMLFSGLSKNKASFAGYHLFRKHCFSCHSINKTGGQVGPEMNWPRNITEYWTDDNIRHYVKEPKSFRYNAHMPAMRQVNDLDIDAIIQYLHYMKKHKYKE
ncbi:c-type cytochrome [Niabella hibiscisoli]|uniref:c-type cytochrome n=1 Tax=Niabella hibiscisoli TaxID=1825928 RepID=UPI001F0D158D|nr:cytochrome c [Niabella hibiscisoli]MCH5720865.1 cytochrome c [Niabella hibiscisoli]